MTTFPPSSQSSSSSTSIHYYIKHNSRQLHISATIKPVFINKIIILHILSSLQAALTLLIGQCSTSLPTGQKPQLQLPDSHPQFPHNTKTSTILTKMSSLLRYAVTPASAAPVSTTQRPTTAQSPAKKQKMSLTQTYYLAHTARGKLSKEAARGDHDLRLLVGHANLLDGLMLDLANAEQEQESWFNQTVKSAAKASEESNKQQQPRVSWADQHTIVEEEAVEEEMYDEDSESDSDDEDEDVTMAMAARKVSAQPMQISLSADEEEQDDEMEVDDEYDAELSLTRTPTRSPSTELSSPPELMHEDESSDDSSEDEEEEEEDSNLPSSPPQTELFSKQAPATSSFFASSSSSSLPLSKPIDDSLYQSQQVAIAAY